MNKIKGIGLNKSKQYVRFKDNGVEMKSADKIKQIRGSILFFISSLMGKSRLKKASR
jgi:hypothetical protein